MPPILLSRLVPDVSGWLPLSSLPLLLYPCASRAFLLAVTAAVLAVLLQRLWGPDRALVPALTVN